MTPETYPSFVVFLQSNLPINGARMILLIKKRITKFLLTVVISLVVATGATIVFLMVEQERLVKLAVVELNKQFKGELTVASSSLSLFRHFPSVGVVLHEPKLFPDKTKTEKSIFDFEKVYVSVSLPDLIAGKYNVRQLSFHGGRLDLVHGDDGKLNLLEAVRIASDTAVAPKSETPFGIDLQKISLKELTISYLDITNGRRITSRINDVTSSLHMDSLRMTTTLKGGMVLDIMSSGDTTFFRHKKVNLDITADYVLNKKLLEIKAASFKLQDASFAVTGIANLAYTPEVNLKIKGQEPDLHLLTAFLPGDIKQQLKPFRYEGEIYFEGVLQGEISQEEVPFVEVSFGCKDAWFLNERADKKVDQLAFTGYYTNGYARTLKSSELHIMNMNARPGKGIFKGNFVMRDFTDPHMLMQLQSELELGFLGHFFGIPDLQQFTGTIRLEMDFKEIMDIKLPEQSLSKLKEGIQSKLSVEDLSFHISGYPNGIRNMNLRAEMKDGKVTLDSASLQIGGSDLRFNGSLSDIQGFLHDPKKTIHLTLDASSDNLVLKELLSYDTAISNHWDDEIHKFHIGLNLETSVEKLLHPSPLPGGKFEIRNLRASFKKYPHVIKDLGAEVSITDTSLQVHNLNGMIDSSDFQFTGRVDNYHLWFNKVKSGRTQISADFKSKRFALDDIFMKGHRKFIPRGYRHEELNDVWMNVKVNLKYDTIFRFAKADITNITGVLKNHKVQVKDVKGKVKYGTNVIALDTLKGIAGKSDFEVSMRLFTGTDMKMKKKMNFVHFYSDVLDLDEIANYDFSVPPAKKKPGQTEQISAPLAKADTAHAKAFNIFTLPFCEFTVWVDVNKVKYNKLWIQDFTGRLRLTEDHFLYVDTVGMKIAGGTLAMKGELNGSDTSRLFFTSVIKADQLDLEKVMVKLDHFGHDVAVNKNVKGRLSGVINSRMQVHPNLVPIVGNSTAHLAINIYDGSLVDFSPLLAMATYFKDKNMRLVRFDTLKNEFSFENGQLNIPTMNINSSLGAIEISGKQSIDLRMEYYVRIPMKMVTKAAFSSLFDKKPDAVDSTQVDQIQYLDKRGHFVNLKVTGTPSDFKVTLGKGGG